MASDRIKIFSENHSPRLTYIAGIILGNILGLQWEIVTDRRKLGKHPVINYSLLNINGSVKIAPATILFETGAVRKDIIISEWKGYPVFFQTDQDADIPFDIFSASFYLVSRYEEYLDYDADEHGRYPASSSIAFRNGFLGKPVIDLWTKEFARIILRKYPTIAFKRNDYNALLTIDSDQPFAYLGKGMIRSVGGLLHDLTVRKGNATGRFRVLTRGEQDPFEVYDYIMSNIDKNGTDARFFFPTGDITKYDKNPSWKNEKYRDLIRKISRKYEVGLHPSYYSSDKPVQLRSQLKRFEEILEKKTVAARFHYIRLKMPDSYRILNEASITEDYSMGYPEEPGFRAGIARPFLFYDLPEDRQTELTIVPFQVMDTTLYQYKKLKPENAGEIIRNLISETQHAGGLFVSLWHNTSLLESQEWKGWRDLFEMMLQIQKP
jgi:hypothetical protein